VELPLDGVKVGKVLDRLLILAGQMGVDALGDRRMRVRGAVGCRRHGALLS
jgi:hypothetical protein